MRDKALAQLRSGELLTEKSSALGPLLKTEFKLHSLDEMMTHS